MIHTRPPTKLGMLAILLAFFILAATPSVHADMAGSMFSPEIRREAQEALNFYGFDAGRPDGVFGNGTQSAIRDYQQSLGGQATGELSRAVMGNLIQRYRADKAKNAPVRSGAGGLPTAVARPVAKLADMCGVSSASLLSRPSFLQKSDINGDGEMDYIIDGTESCSMACGAANCSVYVVASTPSGYRENKFLGYGVVPDTFRCDRTGTCTFR